MFLISWTATLYIWKGVNICPETCCKASLPIIRFTVPPTPSQALFPWAVPKKCHSAIIPKSLS